MFSSDKPLKSYDQLNRTEFSKQLAKALVLYVLNCKTL